MCGVETILSQTSPLIRLAAGATLALTLLSACTIGSIDTPGPSSGLASTPPADPVMDSPDGGLNAEIGHYAALYRVPESLIRRIIVRESGYNAGARNGPYMGLMQIRYETARSMGYDGTPAGLMDPDLNLRYGVRYLAGAWMVAHGDPEKAVSFYATGYFYDAQRLGLLEEVGLKRGRR